VAISGRFAFSPQAEKLTAAPARMMTMTAIAVIERLRMRAVPELHRPSAIKRGA
jgi:hypothetical protein